LDPLRTCDPAAAARPESGRRRNARRSVRGAPAVPIHRQTPRALPGYIVERHRRVLRQVESARGEVLPQMRDRGGAGDSEGCWARDEAARRARPAWAWRRGAQRPRQGRRLQRIEPARAEERNIGDAVAGEIVDQGIAGAVRHIIYYSGLSEEGAALSNSLEAGAAASSNLATWGFGEREQARFGEPILITPRLGQGAFRVRSPNSTVANAR